MRVIVLVLAALMLLQGRATGQVAEGLQVDAFVHGPANAAEVVVTVSNRGPMPIDELRVEVRQARTVRVAQERAGPATGTALVFRLPLSRQAYTTAINHEAELYALVIKRVSNTYDETAAPIAAPKSAPGATAGSTVLTTLLSVGSLLAGVVVTDALARRRERARSALEARRIDAERDTPSYRAFLADWQGSIDPAHLESEFAQLAGKVSVPEDVRHLYTDTVNRLKEPSATLESRTAAADHLLAKIDALTMTPSLD